MRFAINSVPIGLPSSNKTLTPERLLKVVLMIVKIAYVEETEVVV